jgi:hypothetical protein
MKESEEKLSIGSHTLSANGLSPCLRRFIAELQAIPPHTSMFQFGSSGPGSAANKDLTEYRDGYPGKSLNDPSLTENLRFYSGEIKSRPNGDLIDTIHKYNIDYNE